METNLVLEKAIADMKFAANELDYVIGCFEMGRIPSIWGDQCNARDRLRASMERLEKIKGAA